MNNIILDGSCQIAGYDAEADAINIGGHSFAESKKFWNAQDNPRVAFVVDDLASIEPWRPRGIEVRGRAETFEEGGERFGPGSDAASLQIKPAHIVSWGLNRDPFGPENARSV
ncbi:MAG TPA: hypothetical protein VK879_06550 [Candidatus Sulfomarinibacteraceae bacterium]|nr:hypothetical protein [Candidatus Sulfomarinibacteraceae bacterium]